LLNTTDDDDDDEDSGRVPNDSRAYGFDDWGRFDDASPLGASGSTSAPPPTFFTDEPTTRRPASYLQPKAEVKVERRAAQAAVAAKKEEGSSRWRWGRKNTKTEEPGFAAVTAVSAPS
jgi:hypothetical protein